MTQPQAIPGFDSPLGSVGSLLPAGVCYRGLRRLPGQNFHLLEQHVFQDAPFPLRSKKPKTRGIAGKLAIRHGQVELLLSGVALERVSVLPGHASMRITEKHYALWVRERQEQMEADVRRALEG